MEIIRELKEIPNLSLALGFFDGLHLGHQAVIGCAVNFAQENNCPAAVVTFRHHPFCYFQDVKAPKYIWTLDEKYRLMENLGVDYVIELDFDKVKDLTAEEYMQDVLVKYFSPKAISTGFSHYFGKGKSGNVGLLTEWQKKYNYTYFATPAQMLYGVKISSTAIRNYIKEGNVDLAETLLGRKFAVRGTVQKGKRKGHKLGFPTANLFYPLEIIQPPRGVYDVNVILKNGSRHRGIANYGICPTVSSSGITTFEVHILNFDENIYGQEIKVEFNRKIRDEIKFENVDQLKLQIAIDINSLR